MGNERKGSQKAKGKKVHVKEALADLGSECDGILKEEILSELERNEKDGEKKGAVKESEAHAGKGSPRVKGRIGTLIRRDLAGREEMGEKILNIKGEIKKRRIKEKKRKRIKAQYPKMGRSSRRKSSWEMVQKRENGSSRNLRTAENETEGRGRSQEDGGNGKEKGGRNAKRKRPDEEGGKEGPPSSKEGKGETSKESG